jgi:hypothetical protein
MKSLSSSAMLVELNISIWTARKLDKKVSNDVDISNSTQTKAGNYHKNLLAGDSTLAEIGKLAGVIRSYHMSITSPWSDSGQRLLTTAYFMDYKRVMARYERQYWDAVNLFIPSYNTKISAAAFQLGTLFNRDEYPDVDKVRDKFGLSIRYTPVPESGDFRVDIGNEGMEELKAQYDDLYATNVKKVSQDAWDRLYKVLSQLSFGLRTNEDGTKGKIYESVLDNASDLCEVLQHLNVSEDTMLEAMRVKLKDSLQGIEVEDIKKSDYTRGVLKQEVDSLLDKFG